MNIFGNFINNGSNESIRDIEISKLTYDKDFKDLFSQEKGKVKRIAENMKVNGFDRSQPIIVNNKMTVIDGHSRLLAARSLGIKKVPVIIKHFDSKEETLDYELHLQLDRRNLTDAETFDIFMKMENMKANAVKSGKTPSEYSDEKISSRLNKSVRHIQKMRELAKKASPELIGKIKEGKISINKAYTEIKKESQSKASAIKDTKKIDSQSNSNKSIEVSKSGEPNSEVKNTSSSNTSSESNQEGLPSEDYVSGFRAGQLHAVANMKKWMPKDSFMAGLNELKKSGVYFKESEEK